MTTCEEKYSKISENNYELYRKKMIEDDFIKKFINLYVNYCTEISIERIKNGTIFEENQIIINSFLFMILGDKNEEIIELLMSVNLNDESKFNICKKLNEDENFLNNYLLVLKKYWKKNIFIMYKKDIETAIKTNIFIMENGNIDNFIIKMVYKLLFEDDD